MAKAADIDVSGLETYHNPADLRRDLHVLLDYVRDREVKRRHRDNGWPKADAQRLAKRMSDPATAGDLDGQGDSAWIDVVDSLAHKLGLIAYDRKGTYAGYWSNEPSYPENFIECNAEKYQKFVALPLAEQETRISNALITGNKVCGSEFFNTSVLGRLGSFSTRGCDTDVMRMLDFTRIRRFLLEELRLCPVGVWCSVASLVQRLKTNEPFFMIPQHPRDKQGKKLSRYGTFRESKDPWSYNLKIPETADDAFERVEGRYIERFLEGAPLTLGYIDVAYERDPKVTIYPSMNVLTAFRVRSTLAPAIEQKVPQPKVTVQPNFEICVESEFYPANVLEQLVPVADLLSQDTATILKLNKLKVAAQVAESPSFDAAALLARLTGQALPQNVQYELRAWSAAADTFTLYENFAVFEGDDRLPPVDPFTVERIAPGVRLVHSPDTLFAELEKAELVPQTVAHSNSAVKPLPTAARTVFPKASKKSAGRVAKTSATVKRSTSLTLRFSDRDVFEKFRKALLDARCPVAVDAGRLSFDYSKCHEPEVAKAIATVGKCYKLRIQDVD